MVMRGQGKHIRFFLKIYDASTASHRQNYTSLYSFDCEFRRCRNSLLFNTSGIRAAAEKSSTYQRYASALFSANSLYLHCLFLKALEILNGIYFSPEPSRRIRTDKDVRGFAVGQHTGRYAVQQAISKRLTETPFSKALDIIHLFLGFISSFLYIFDVFAVYFSVIRVTQILTQTYIPQEESCRVYTGFLLGIIIYCFIRQFTTNFLSTFAIWMRVKQIN